MPPQALLEDIVTTVQDPFLGLEALALASICERSELTPKLEKFPAIPGLAETPEARSRLRAHGCAAGAIMDSGLPHAYHMAESIESRGRKRQGQEGQG